MSGDGVATSPAGPVTVSAVVNVAERREFVELPYRLYSGDPYWVPPLRRDIHELLDPARHPFHQHATVQLFLARDRGGRVVGRVAAIRNDRYLEEHGDSVGFFGFFECVNEPEVARALLDAAAGWLSEMGLTTMRGPMSFSLNEEAGLLVDGFDGSPMVMMPYNPAWYAALIEGAGFAKTRDLLAYSIVYEGAARTPPERIVRLADALARRNNVVIRSLDMSRFWEEMERIEQVYNGAWAKNWGHVSMTAAELRHMARQFKPVVDPELVLFAEVNGELAGFALGLPDMNQVLKHLDGRLFPFGWAKALWHSRRVNAFRVLTVGVLEPYRRMGVAELMYLRFWSVCPPRGITSGEQSWILENNTLMRTALEKLGARLYRTYRLYDRSLDA